MIGKWISRLFGLILLAGVLGILALGGYFWHKSGQPMQVEEAQRRVPGITFREFWKDRSSKWDKWNDELTAIGKGRPCGTFARDLFVPTIVFSAGDLIYIRTHQGTEVDLVFTKGLTVVATAEIKYSNSPQLTKGNFQAFEDLNAPMNYVITPFSDNYIFKERIRICSLKAFISNYLPIF